MRPRPPYVRRSAPARRRLVLRRRSRDERGYVAVLVGLLIVPLIGISAFAVDVGQWYVVARDAQRAADAGALGGVTYLPADPGAAFGTAADLAGDNGFRDSAGDVSVDTTIDKSPTQLRVTVSRNVPSIFGRLFGVDATTITRTAVADYAGPVPLGSPCNVFGNAPDSEGKVSDVCDDVGQFWGNIGSPKANKVSGDAFQNNFCASGTDQCLSGKNLDYDPNGYFYSITLRKPVNNLVIEAFDPAFVHVGDLCTSNLADATRFGARYASGKGSEYCTGDQSFGGTSGGFTNMVATDFTVRDPGPNPWDPLSFPERTACTGAGRYPGYAGPLVRALDPADAAYRDRPSYHPRNVGIAGEDGYVAKVFRQWVPLCEIGTAPAGTYLVQMRTNGIDADQGNGHNRFALRAYSSSDPTAKDAIAISGFAKMAIYANLPEADTKFYLARVPSGAASQILNIKLFDVGDSTTPGKIQILAPPKSGVSFGTCTSTGVMEGLMPFCELPGVNSKYNGRWQTISVPIPEEYRCDDRDPTDCWVRLQYDYGSGNQPSDTTSWAASIEGDPVRLIE